MTAPVGVPSEGKEKQTKVKEQSLREEIEFPEGISAELIGNELIVKKDGLEIKRKINVMIETKIEGNKIILSSSRARKTEKKVFGTMKAHVRNMIKGLDEGFKYRLQISNVHFPMNVSHDKAENVLVVKNFLGEKVDRRIKLVEGVDVKVDKEIIELESHDREKAGQCAANIEKGTRVRNKDRRVFQDGIFIIEKPGRRFM
jgi:large subunit ribosomal protein L6